MKRFQNRIKILFLLVLSVFINSCENPIEGIDLIIDIDAYDNSPVSVFFLNANDMSSTTLGDFDVEIGGEGAEFIVNETGKKEFRAVDGMLAMALDRGVDASASKPIVFTVSAKVNGFAPISQTISIVDEHAATYTVRMVEYSKPPEGTFIVESSDPLTGGTSAATAKVFRFPATPTKSDAATIQLQSSTQMRNAAGNLFTANRVNSRFVHYGVDSEASLAGFPGGFLLNIIYDTDGSNIGPGSFVTGGFFSVNLEAGGQVVKSLSKPLKAEMELNASIRNPATGTLIKEGDRISLVSLNEEKKVWSVENSLTIRKNAAGKLIAPFDMNHMGYWAVGYFIPSCNSNSTVTVIANGAAVEKQYYIELVSPDGQKLTNYSTVRKSFNQGSNQIVLENIPNTTAHFEVYEFSTKMRVARSAAFNPCRGGTQVTLDVSQLPELVNVALTLNGRCGTDPFRATPYAWIAFYEVDDTNNETYKYGAYVKSGKADLVLQTGTKYKVNVLFNGSSYWTNLSFNKSDTVLPEAEGLSGTVAYDPATNLASINMLYTFKDCK